MRSLNPKTPDCWIDGATGRALAIANRLDALLVEQGPMQAGSLWRWPTYADGVDMSVAEGAGTALHAHLPADTQTATKRLSKSAWAWSPEAQPYAVRRHGSVVLGCRLVDRVETEAVLLAQVLLSAGAVA